MLRSPYVSAFHKNVFFFVIYECEQSPQGSNHLLRSATKKLLKSLQNRISSCAWCCGCAQRIQGRKKVKQVWQLVSYKAAVHTAKLLPDAVSSLEAMKSETTKFTICSTLSIACRSCSTRCLITLLLSTLLCVNIRECPALLSNSKVCESAVVGVVRDGAVWQLEANSVRWTLLWAKIWIDAESRQNFADNFARKRSDLGFRSSLALTDLATVPDRTTSIQHEERNFAANQNRVVASKIWSVRFRSCEFCRLVIVPSDAATITYN